MSDEQKARLRTYAWNYFSYHAEQRLKSFNFYVILVTAILAGLLTAATRVTAKELWLLSPLGILITLLSLMFGLLDRRNKELITNGEAALRFLDENEGLIDTNGRPHPMKIFSNDDFEVSLKQRLPLSAAHMSYSIVFKCLFWLFGLMGIVLAIACIALYRP